MCAHTNDLVYNWNGLILAFFKAIGNNTVWNSYERPKMEQLQNADFTFGCVDSVASYIQLGKMLPEYKILLIDECHHVGSSMYDKVFEALSAGKPGGTFALGLTATPWRPDEIDLTDYFGYPRVSIDMDNRIKKGILGKC